MIDIVFKLKAVDMVLNEKFGYMAALRGTEIVEVPLEEAVDINVGWKDITTAKMYYLHLKGGEKARNIIQNFNFNF